MYLFFRLQGYPGELGLMGSPGEQGQMVPICEDCACANFWKDLVFELIEMKLHTFSGSTWSTRTAWLCRTKWPTRRCYTLICVLFVSVRNKLLFSCWFGNRRTPSSGSLPVPLFFPPWERGCALLLEWGRSYSLRSRRDVFDCGRPLFSDFTFDCGFFIFKGQRGELGKDGKPGLMVSQHILWKIT